MLAIGDYNDLVIEREVDFGVYLGTGIDEVLMPSKYVPDTARVGDNIRVFVYTDSEDRPIATTLVPHGRVGDFVALEVVDTSPIGAFMDWGLEKDLLVPNAEQQSPMAVGQRHVVRICLDRATGRVFGTSRIPAVLDSDTQDLAAGDAVEILVYGITDIGIMAVVNQRFGGMLYKNEVFEPLVPGDVKQGYVRQVRDDGKIDLVLKKPGYESVGGSRLKIREVLEANNGFIPCHDKSSPDEIRQWFSMSKKEFKRSIGGLYKDGEILITDQGISLKP